MGEIRIKSGNLVESYVADNNKNRYIAVLYAEADLKPNTTYTIALTINEGYDVYFNEKVFSNWSAFTGDGTYQVFALTTRSDLTKNNNTYTSGKGWWILKNNKYQANFINVSDFQILEGAYTSETIPEYQPYFLNKPAHRYTNGQFVDIPTHHYTNGRWQGELTSQSPLKFRADGEMLDWRVEGRTSGNLFDGTLIPTTTLGVTFRLDNNGYMYASPTNSDTRGWTYANSQIKVTLPSGNYTLCLSGTPSTSVNSGIRVNDDANKNLAYKGAINGQSTVIINFAVTDNHNIGIVAKIHDGRFRVQILKGTYTSSTIPPYEPYGGVGDWDEEANKYKIPVNVRGDNLYSSAWEQGFWAYDTGARWGTDSKYVRTAKMPCEGNTKYEFVCSLPDGSKDYGFVFWDTNGNYIDSIHSSDVQNTPVKYFATSPANAKMMAVNIARYSDGERHPVDILGFDLYELHEVNLFTDHQLMDGDSIDFATDQTAIPIATGNNTLTVDTAVKPSKVFVKFEG